MIHDYKTSDLDADTIAMCDYAVKITCQFNFSNRVTMGLGLEPPPGRSTLLRRWLTGPAQDYDWLKYDEDIEPDEE